MYRWSGLNQCLFRLTRAAGTAEQQAMDGASPVSSTPSLPSEDRVSDCIMCLFVTLPVDLCCCGVHRAR